jgi:hypothetical protein
VSFFFFTVPLYGALRPGSGDGCEQAVIVLAARAAGTKVRGGTREAALGRPYTVREDDIDVNVQDFHCPVTSHIPRISPQELPEGLPSGHGAPPSASR